MADMRSTIVKNHKTAVPASIFVLVGGMLYFLVGKVPDAEPEDVDPLADDGGVEMSEHKWYAITRGPKKDAAVFVLILCAAALLAIVMTTPKFIEMNTGEASTESSVAFGRFKSMNKYDGHSGPGHSDPGHSGPDHSGPGHSDPDQRPKLTREAAIAGLTTDPELLTKTQLEKLAFRTNNGGKNSYKEYPHLKFKTTDGH
jgi:hypothetical protein